MKVGAISGDMAIKLALTAGALIAAYYAWQKLKSAGSSVASMAGSVAEAVAAVPADVVITTGKVLGIPETNNDKYQADMAAGRYGAATLDGTASQYFTEVLPASVKAIWQSLTTPSPDASAAAVLASPSNSSEYLF